MSRRPHLRALARELGVEDGYRSALSARWIPTRDTTREALIEAMGYAAASEASARASLARLRDLYRERARSARGPERARALRADEVFGQRRAFGIWTHLYGLRSAQNLGWGNTRD
ncbi:MAG: hypothetical protein ACREI7_09580, partial [Myxococcota bacterium]